MEREHSEDVNVDWRIILKWIVERADERVWTVFVLLRIGTSDGILLIR
jgi:hypothetical protein